MNKLLLTSGWCHSDSQALVKPTLLALGACQLVNDAIVIQLAGVLNILLDRSSKESLKKETTIPL